LWRGTIVRGECWVEVGGKGRKAALKKIEGGKALRRRPRASGGLRPEGRLKADQGPLEAP
jgi:hypothetical protein